MSYTEEQQTAIETFFSNYPMEERAYSQEETTMCLTEMNNAVVFLMREAVKDRSVALMRDARALANELIAIRQTIMNQALESMRKSGLVAAGATPSLETTEGWKK